MVVVSFCIGARTAFENERGIQFADHGDAGGMAGVVGMRRPFAATHVQVHVEVHVELLCARQPTELNPDRNLAHCLAGAPRIDPPGLFDLFRMTPAPRATP